MNVSCTVMAHIKRVEEATDLYVKLMKMPFARVTISMDYDNDEWNNGRNAWVDAETFEDFHCVIQDDSIISDNFYENLETALRQAPANDILSLYTGTSRPFKNQVQKAVDKAKEENASWLKSNRLMWGVAIVMKTEHIEHMLKYVEKSTLPYDERIGSYFKHIGKQVYYCRPSIVNHRDEQSLIKKVHNYPRVAHEYSDDVLEFKGGVISI